MRRLLGWLIVATLLFSATACTKSEGSVKGADVTMANGHRFAPTTVTVKAGDTVAFANAGAESHTVTAYQDSIPAGGKYFASGGASSEKNARDDVASGLIKGGGSYTVTLDAPGTYTFFCIPHESDGMKGKIVVQP